MCTGTSVTREESLEGVCVPFWPPSKKKSTLSYLPVRTGRNLLLCIYLILSKHPQYFVLQNYSAFRHSLQASLKKNWWINISTVKDTGHLEMQFLLQQFGTCIWTAPCSGHHTSR